MENVAVKAFAWVIVRSFFDLLNNVNLSIINSVSEDEFVSDL